MRMFFNHIVDINNKKKKHPKSADYNAFFFTRDAQYFIYALCTKSDLTQPELIQVDYDTYMSAKTIVAESGEVAEIAMKDAATVQATVQFVRLKSGSDNVTIGSLLNLEE